MADLRIGKVVNSYAGTTRGGSQKVLFAQTQFSPSTNVRDIQYSLAPGIDANPAPGARVLYTDSGGNYKFIVAGTDNIIPESNPGEIEIYSTDGSVHKGRIKARADGSIYIANVPGGINLKKALQDLIAGIQGATYIPYPGGSPGAPVPIVDATGKIATALTELNTLLSSTP